MGAAAAAAAADTAAAKAKAAATEAEAARPSMRVQPLCGELWNVSAAVWWLLRRADPFPAAAVQELRGVVWHATMTRLMRSPQRHANRAKRGTQGVWTSVWCSM